MSTLTAFPYIGEQSFATPGAINSPLSIISANIAAVNAAAGAVSGVTITPPSGNTITIASDLSILGTIAAGPARLGVSSNRTNYLFLSDTSNARSNYVIGSQVGGTADGLNIWDDSGQTMLVSFSKQSIRFYQNVVGPVFDVGGALANTLNAATFGTGSDSVESRIQAAISAATASGISRVYVPANLYPYRSGLVTFATSVQMVREGGDWSLYDVWAYGARGVGHDAAAAQGAVNGAAANGGTVYFPAGTYNMASSITAVGVTNLQIRGPGSNGALISMAASGVTLLRFTGVCSGVIIRDLWLGSFSSAFTFGGSLEITGTAGVHSGSFLVENVTCQNTPYPVTLQYLDNSNFNNLRIFSSFKSCVRGNGMYMNNVLSTNFQEFFGTYLSSGASYPADLVVMDYDCDTVIFMDSQALGAIGYGFRVRNTGGSTGPRLCRLTNTLVESCTSGGFKIEAARDFHMASCHAAVNGGPGFNVTGGDSVQIYDSLALQNNEDGVIVSGGRGVEITGNVLSNNGQTAANTYDGIAIASGTSGIRIANNRSGDFLIAGAATQRSGLSIAASTDYLNVSNNDLIGNVGAGFFSASTGLNNFVLDSSNLTTSSGGTLTALAGAIIRNTLLVGGEVPSGGEILRTTSHARITGYAIVTGANGAFRFDNRTSSGSSILAIFNQSGTDFNFANASNNNLYMRLGGTVFSAISLTPETSGAADLGSTNRPWGVLSLATGINLKSGANKSCGTAVLGSNGSVNVANTYIAAGDLIFLTDQTPGGTLGDLEVGGIRAGSGFTIQSTSVTDTSTVGWLIIRPT